MAAEQLFPAANVDSPGGAALHDEPLRPAAADTVGDRIFRGVAATAALTSAAVVGITVYFLLKESGPAFHASGIIRFFTSATWNVDANRLGVLGVLGGSAIISAIALVVGAPAGVAMAIFINEIAPPRLRRPLTSVIDLLAALPSILFGIWGYFALKPVLLRIARWVSVHLAVIPSFRVGAQQQIGGGSSFVAGVVVGLMILPIVASVSREVMAQVPRDQCEAALALGGTRWGMVRDVLLPPSRSGIVSSIILGLGRALGETVAISFLIVFSFKLNTHVLTNPANSITALILTRFGEGGKVAQSGLIAAGFALFILTLVVNFAAKAITARGPKLQ